MARGDVVLLGVLLGAAAASTASGLAATLALGSTLVRWGTPSLGALAGNQAVVGLAGFSGTVAAAASAWCAAAALVAAATPLDEPIGWRRALAALPFGLAAALVVAGPGPGGAMIGRVLASIVAVGAAAVVAMRVDARLRVPASAVLATAATALAAAGT